MPELPEVETIRRDLEGAVLGKKIQKVEMKVEKIVKEPSLPEFKRKAQGAVFNKILRRGKVLICQLQTLKSEPTYMVIHLRLTGQLIYGPKDKQSRVNFLLSDDNYLNLNDQRLLGEIRLVKDWQSLSFIEEMGPEPLDKDFTLQNFQERLKTKRTKIKPLLMDQAFIAGLGNLYAAEALFRAGIHPLRTASSLEEKETKELFSAIREILQEAIKYRGSSVDTYRDISGKKGRFEQRLQVYGREGEACFRCKTSIKRITLGGRGTYFCSKCQR